MYIRQCLINVRDGEKNEYTVEVTELTANEITRLLLPGSGQCN